MKKRFAPLLMFALIIAFSCNDEIPHDPTIAIDDVAIENFVRFIDFNVDEALRTATSDPQKIAEQITIRIPEFERQHRIDLDYHSSRASSFAREIVRSKNNAGLAQKIVYYSSISANENQYLSRLSILKRQVQLSGMSRGEKAALLTQITLNERFVRYLQQKVATYKSSGEDDDDEECKGWWSCWGKCVAGIVGGAGTGALTFGFAGAAAGTVTVPIVGTISLGVVGAVAGGVAGGLGGAAASCD